MNHLFYVSPYFLFIKEILCNFLVRALQYFFLNFNFFYPESMKKTPSKVAHNRPNFFFSVANQPKSHFLFHQNVSLHDFYIMTLVCTMHASSTFISQSQIFLRKRFKDQNWLLSMIVIQSRFYRLTLKCKKSCMYKENIVNFKAHLFWEGQKIWQNLQTFLTLLIKYNFKKSFETSSCIFKNPRCTRPASEARKSESSIV